MQIRYTHKLSMHKADFSQNRKLDLDLRKFSEILNSNATLDKYPVHQIKINFKH